MTETFSFILALFQNQYLAIGGSVVGVVIAIGLVFKFSRIGHIELKGKSFSFSMSKEKRKAKKEAKAKKDKA